MNEPKRTAWRGGGLAVAGVAIIAAWAVVWVLREQLFRIAFERDSMWAMSALLHLDGELARSQSEDGGVFLYPKRMAGVAPLSPLAIACVEREPKVIDLFLRLGHLTDDDKLLAAAILFVYRRPEELAELEPRFDPRIWRRVEDSKSWEPAKRLLLTSWRAMFRLRAEAAAKPTGPATPRKSWVKRAAKAPASIEAPAQELPPASLP